MIDAKAAARIAEILVVECGADASTLTNWGFERSINDYRPYEFRFMGRLGFGGKFHIDHGGRMYVDCYAEDENTPRMRMIRKANKRLEELRRELGVPTRASST